MTTTTAIIEWNRDADFQESLFFKGKEFLKESPHVQLWTYGSNHESIMVVKRFYGACYQLWVYRPWIESFIPFILESYPDDGTEEGPAPEWTYCE